MKAYKFSMLNVLVALASCLALASCSDDDETVYADYAAPTITSFSPTEGFSSNVVTITGTEFGSERSDHVIGRVYFGGVEASDYVSWSDTEIQVRVPDGAVSGVITLWVWKNYDETSEEFNVLEGASFTGYDQEYYAEGDTLLLYGENYDVFIERGVTADDIVATFSTQEGTTVEGYATEFNEEYIAIVIPDDAVTGTFTVAFGEWQTVTAPTVTITGYFCYYFKESDVVSVVGSSNFCSYTAAEGGGTCYYDKGIYVDGFDSSYTPVSTTIWDSTSGDQIVLQVTLLEDGDYYVYFGTKGKDTGNVIVSIGPDLDNLTTISQECTASGYTWPTSVYEYGIYTLSAGLNYIQIDFEAGLALTDPHITNTQE